MYNILRSKPLGVTTQRLAVILLCHNIFLRPEKVAIFFVLATTHLFPHNVFVPPPLPSNTFITHIYLHTISILPPPTLSIITSPPITTPKLANTPLSPELPDYQSPACHPPPY